MVRSLGHPANGLNVNDTSNECHTIPVHLHVSVMYRLVLPYTQRRAFPSCREEGNEAVLRWDLSLVAVVIASNCWVITAPQAAWLNVFWLNTNDWLGICPCGGRERTRAQWKVSLLFATIKIAILISSIFLKYFCEGVLGFSYGCWQRNYVPLEQRKGADRDRQSDKRGDGISRSPPSFTLSSLHLPSHSSIVISPLFLFFFPHTPCTVLDNPCIFNIAASSKLWTYSLAFRVLMKARRVLAPLLFPYTSSQRLSSSPTSPAASYTIYNTSAPTCPSPLRLSIAFSFELRIQLHKGRLTI